MNQKQLELLKKLVKLANNNPNEHEANSAARRVCKILEEHNFSFDNTIPPKEKTITYNDVKRSAEYFWKSSKPNRPSYDPWTDFNFDSIYEDLRKKAQEKRKESEYKSQYYGEYNPFTREKDPYYNVNTRPMYDNFGNRIKKEKSIMKCKTCGELKETVFMGVPELFECNDCQWNFYNRVKQNENK